MRYVQNYLLIGLPLFILYIVCATFFSKSEFTNYIFSHYFTIWHPLGIAMLLWFAALVIFFVGLITFPGIREKTLKRLANLNERDEREQYITGLASRSAYVSTLSLMLFLLVFSMFTLNLTSLPKKAASDPGYRLSVDMHFTLLNKSSEASIPGEKTLFDSKEFSLSNTSIVLILLVWQLLAFNITARRENRKDIC